MAVFHGTRSADNPWDGQIIVGVVANLAVGVKVWRTVKQKKRVTRDLEGRTMT